MTTVSVDEKRTGHMGGVNNVAFSPDGNTLASASGDETVKLWDAHTGALKRTLPGHTDYVISVSFSPDGNTLASASGDETVKLWDVGTGALKRVFAHAGSVYCVAFSPDGNTLASVAGGYGDTMVLLLSLFR